jgi:DNA-directed RNA polymerase subunit RPC12/RpoP
MELIEDLGQLYPKPTSKRTYRYGLYKCPDCGEPTKAQTTSVNRGQTTRCASCGGKKSAKGHTKESRSTHGASGTRLYNIWNGMIDRCRRENHPMFHHYGGKGISVDPVWNVFIIFRDWAESNGYEEHLTIERVDNDGNYEPSNCKWATRKEQCNNQTHSIITRYSKEQLFNWKAECFLSDLTIKEFARSIELSEHGLYKLMRGEYDVFL